VRDKAACVVKSESIGETLVDAVEASGEDDDVFSKEMQNEGC
jgi:hypothetical protein